MYSHTRLSPKSNDDTIYKQTNKKSEESSIAYQRAPI